MTGPEDSSSSSSSSSEGRDKPDVSWGNCMNSWSSFLCYSAQCSEGCLSFCEPSGSRVFLGPFHCLRCVYSQTFSTQPSLILRGMMLFAFFLKSTISSLVLTVLRSKFLSLHSTVSCSTLPLWVDSSLQRWVLLLQCHQCLVTSLYERTVLSLPRQKSMENILCRPLISVDKLVWIRHRGDKKKKTGCSFWWSSGSMPSSPFFGQRL